MIRPARASLEELLLDYEDFLRHRRLRKWAPDDPESLAVREVGKKNRSDPPDPSDLSDEQRYALYAPWLEHDDPAVRANALLCLINQTNYLLDRQIEALEAQFIGEGGYSEQLAAARLAERNRKRTGGSPNPSDVLPACPNCGRTMVLRTAQKGPNAGQSFWGCSGYPECKGLLDV